MSCHRLNCKYFFPGPVNCREGDPVPAQPGCGAILR